MITFTKEKQRPKKIHQKQNQKKTPHPKQPEQTNKQTKQLCNGAAKTDLMKQTLRIAVSVSVTW